MDPLNTILRADLVYHRTSVMASHLLKWPRQVRWVGRLHWSQTREEEMPSASEKAAGQRWGPVLAWKLPLAALLSPALPRSHSHHGSALLYLYPSKILVFLPRTFFCMFYSLPTSLSPTHANSLQDPAQAWFLQGALLECTGSDKPAMPLLRHPVLTSPGHLLCCTRASANTSDLLTTHLTVRSWTVGAAN